MNTLRTAHRHALYYSLRALQALPTPLLKRLVRALKVPAYPETDLNMRLLLGLAQKSKRPAQIGKIHQLRRQYQLGCTQMQAPQSPEIKTQNLKIHGYDARHYRQKEKPQNENLVLFIHGGGFCIGGLDTHDEICRSIVSLNKWQVLSISYPLAPEHPAPKALDHCLSAYHWLIKHSAQFSEKPLNIILCGDSAGACLCALLAHHISQSQKTNPIKAQLLFYPVIDIEGDYQSRKTYGKGMPLTQNDFDVFKHSLLEKSTITKNNYQQLAPLYNTNPNMPASYIVTADLDMFRDENISYIAKLQAQAVPCRQEIIKGVPHGFLHLISVHQGTGNSFKKTLQNFAKWLDEPKD